MNVKRVIAATLQSGHSWRRCRDAVEPCSSSPDVSSSSSSHENPDRLATIDERSPTRQSLTINAARRGIIVPLPDNTIAVKSLKCAPPPADDNLGSSRSSAKEFPMSVSSVSVSSTAAYTPLKPPAATKPAKSGGDADGDNDGTTPAQAAAYKSGTAIDLKG